MGEALAIAAIVMLVLLFTSAAVAGAVWHRVRQRNEVSTRHPTHPPLRWLGAPGACGRLHRRLRAAVSALRFAVPVPSRRRRRDRDDPSTVAPLADEIEARAVALDRQLQLADRLRGPAATAARRVLARQVADIELLAHRVAAAAMAAQQRPGTEPTPEALARVAEQLDALDAARDEIARLEATAGLRTVDRSARDQGAVVIDGQALHRRPAR